MCNCKDVEPGSYDNQILLGYYPVMLDYQKARIAAGLSGAGIPVDRCLVGEVIRLWKAGIRTYGCCCGHNGKSDAFINVDPNDFHKALSLGWARYTFKDDLGRMDTIIPNCTTGE